MNRLNTPTYPGMYRSRIFFSRVAILFLPIAALIVVLTLFFYHSEIAREMISIRAQEVQGVRTGADQMRYTMEAIARDLSYLVHSRALQNAVDHGDRSSIRELANNHAWFLRTMAMFDKVRWIDETGRERMRVNYAAGRPFVVPERELQNKGQRYYFVDAMKLERGKIYVSPLDLNVEEGTVELPYKPIIRLATPVFSSRGKKRGILIVSYLAEKMLDEFALDTRSIGDHIMILNREGYWIKSNNAEDEWGFMFNRKKTLETRTPTAWARIRGADAGQFEDSGDLWTFETVYPLSANLQSSTGAGNPVAPSRAEVGPDEYYWKVVSHYPKARINALGRRHTARIALVSLLLLGIMLVGSLITANAWTRQKIAEAEHQQSAERLALLMDNMGEGVFGVDRIGRCTFINPAALSLLGYRRDEMIGRDLQALFPSGGESGTDRVRRDVMLEAANNGNLWSGDAELVRKNGRRFPAQVSAAPIKRDGDILGAVVVFQDDTERRQMENRLRQTQKIEAVRTLARGVAHDFNNILTAISGHAHLLSLSLPEQNPLAEDVRRITESSERARQVVQRLLAFSKEQLLDAVPIDLDAFVSLLVSHLRSTIDANVTIDLRTSGKAPMVLADRMQLEEALANLVANAADAMPSGGTITMETGSLLVDDGFILKRGHGSPGRYAFLSVGDRGEGMDEETRQRIFEPFFTTREVGKGSGLGLAMVYGIVEQLGGFMEVESKQLQGTTVTLFLPIATAGT